jgi:hypothetical protein
MLEVELSLDSGLLWRAPDSTLGRSLPIQDLVCCV